MFLNGDDTITANYCSCYTYINRGEFKKNTQSGSRAWG